MTSISALSLPPGPSSVPMSASTISVVGLVLGSRSLFGNDGVLGSMLDDSGMLDCIPYSWILGSSSGSSSTSASETNVGVDLANPHVSRDV
jgi:hypothetical protein